MFPSIFLIFFKIFFKVYLLKWSSHQLTVRNMIGFGSLNMLAMPCLFWSWLFSLLWFSSIHGCGKCSTYSVATLRFAFWYDIKFTYFTDFLIDGWCIGTFFFWNFLKVEIFWIPFTYILEKINKNYDRKYFFWISWCI